MPGYVGMKEVRKINGQQFIDDFLRHSTFLVSPLNTNYYFTASKQEIWERAKLGKIHYVVSTEIFSNLRSCIVII